MLNTIMGALLPMVVTFLLGFVAAWRHNFGSMEASPLNRMVLLYALPLTLFAATITTSRAALSQDIPLVIALCVAIIVFYGVVFLFSRVVFRMAVGTSALAALTASAPAVPFVGPAVLGDLFGAIAPSRSQYPVSSLISQSCQSRFCFSHWIRQGVTHRKTHLSCKGDSIRQRRPGRTRQSSRSNLGKLSKNRLCGRRF
jgi:hypothetical protein